MRGAVLDRLIDTGHDVTILAPGPGLTSYRRNVVCRVRVLDRPGRQVGAALEAARPDVVHVVTPGLLGRQALEHSRRLGVPSLVVQQSPVGDLGWDRWRSGAARASSWGTSGRLATLGEIPGIRPVIMGDGRSSAGSSHDCRSRCSSAHWPPATGALAGLAVLMIRVRCGMRSPRSLQTPTGCCWAARADGTPSSAPGPPPRTS